MKDYKESLELQFSNLEFPGIQALYKEIFSKISDNLPKKGKILEVGAGAGGSAKFLGELDVLRTDLAMSVQGRVIGNVNVQSLPFPPNMFDGVIAVDVIHHLSNPELGISEMLRVSKSGARLAIVEPFVSPLSYFFYKALHSEDVSIYLNANKLAGIVGDSPESGNQTIMQSLVKSNYFRRLLEKKEISVEKIEYFAPLSLYATGGIMKPFRVSENLIRNLIRMERKMPNNLKKLTGSRQICVIAKC